jgi:hypothetical protein
LNYGYVAFQYERFFQPEATVVASVFAPIMFPPCPVLVYKEMKDHSHVSFIKQMLLFHCLKDLCICRWSDEMVETF